MESPVGKWICLIGPEVPGKVMLGHICAHSWKISLKNIARVSPNSRVILGKQSAKWASCEELKRSSRFRLGLPVPALEPAFAPLPQFSSSVKWESSLLIFPDSQWECEGPWDGVSFPSLPCSSASHTSLPEDIGKGWSSFDFIVLWTWQGTQSTLLRSRPTEPSLILVNIQVLGSFPRTIGWITLLDTDAEASLLLHRRHSSG